MSKGASAADVVGGIFDPAGWMVRTGLEVLAKDRPKRPTKRQAAELVAAGYTQAAGRGRQIAARPWLDPAGRAISADAARIAARQIPQPGPVLQTGEELFEELLRKRDYRPPDRLPRSGGVFDDLIRRPRTPAPSPDAPRSPAARARRAGRLLGRVGGIIGGILYPSVLGDSDLYPPGTAIPLPEPDRPRGPPRRPVLTRPPKSPLPRPSPWPESIPDRIGTRPVPLPRSPAPFPTILLPAPDVARQPKRRPRPNVLPTTASPLGPLRAPLTSLLVSRPFPSPVRRPALLPDAAILGRMPRSAIDPVNRLAPLTGLQTMALKLPTDPPRDRCDRVKRKPSKPRTVCYSGSYRERARGIDKQPRRKVPCL